MKTNYPVANLGDHVRQVSQRNKGESGTEVFSVTNSEGFTRSTDYFSKEVFSKDISNYKVVRKGQFAYNPSRINVGSIDYLRPTEKALVSPLYVVFETDSELSADYLLRYMKSDWGNAQIRANTEGAVRDSLKYKGLESIKIPLPPLDGQKRIAHLLGKVERLIARRKHHQQQLDDLLKSVFLEMFGDPVRNEKGWDTGSLSSYGSFKNGLNFGKGESGVTVRYLGVGDFKSRSKLADIDALAFIELNQLPAADYFLQNGDLLFVRSNGNRELVGRCMAVYPGTESVTYSGFCIRYRINTPDIHPTYIAHLFRSAAFRRTLFQGGQGANIQNINQRALSDLPIPLPSEGMQNQFAAIVEKVEGLKSRYQQSLTDLESLYGALSQKAFKGELDLSRVVLPAEGPETAEKEKTDVEENHPMEPLFDLPAPEELAVLQTTEGRKFLLGEWLNAWLEQLGDASFSAQAFMEAARQRLWELAEDDAPDWGVAEYDELRAWVFEALEQGRLNQGYDDANNRVQITAAKG